MTHDVSETREVPDAPPSFHRWQRFLSGYQAVATFLLNFSILLTVSTLVLTGLYALLDRHRESASQTQVYSQHFDLDSYQHIDRATALKTGAEFDRMGEAESYRFYPWTVFSERAFDGDLVSVDADGVRVSAAPEVPGDRLPLDVWCFGGSTMFGWGQPNHETIPSHLQALLQAQFPNRAVKVSNHGHSYWFSSMELNHLLALLRHHPQPDAVIFLDGLNDSRMFLEGRHSPFFTHIADRAWEAERQRRHAPLQGPWLRMGASFPWLRAAQSLRSRLGLDPIKVTDGPDLEPVDVATALARYAVNRRAIRAVGEDLGMIVHQYLQPIPGYGPYLNETKEMGGDIYAFYDALIANPEDGQIPIHDVLYGLQRPFVDQTHYSDQGNFLVAERISEHLLTAIAIEH